MIRNAVRMTMIIRKANSPDTSIERRSGVQPRRLIIPACLCWMTGIPPKMPVNMRDIPSIPGTR